MDRVFPPATTPNARLRPQPNRSNGSRLITRRVPISILVAISCFCALGVAVAQETPVLVAKALPGIDNYCGNHAVTFESVTKTRKGIVWLDVLTGKKTKLQFGLSTILLQCSPDSRWVLTEHDVGTVPSGDDPNFGEGGSGDCNEDDDGHLTRVVLWDTERGTHQVVGTGYMDFRWSPDGKLLIYRFRPFCNLESQPRNSFKLPAQVGEFQAISARDMIARLLGPNGGWRGKRRIGVMSWYAADAFVVQLPDGEGNPLDDSTPAGAIVAVHHISGSDAKIEQLNPSEFKSTFKFAIPQAPLAASALILQAGLCIVLPIQDHPSVLSCNKPEDANLAQVFQLDLTKYCQTLRVGDVEQFCASNPPPYSWTRTVLGSTVLLFKHFSERSRVEDLFRMENDHEGYLK